ncbi:MAG: putative DNA binding domain-containing protein [Acidobacteria bacterium]|nr:putative DNA binding domain-containing protein [Acidobacteriota bacterium]
MSRKRSNHSRRYPPSTERSYHEYLLSVPAPTTSRAELVRMLRGGEDSYLELKVKFSNIEKLTAEIIALANTDGGALVFGVTDQLRIEGVDDPEKIEAELREICSTLIQPPVFPYIKKVAFDNGRRIVMLEVEPHRRPHHTQDFKFFLREGSSKRETSREELAEIYGESPRVRFEQTPMLRASMADIDESLLWSFVRGANPQEWANNDRGFPTAQIMHDLGLAVRIGDDILPTLGGMLLFGLHEKIPHLIPQASVLLTRFSGKNSDSPIIERQQIHGNLLWLFESSMRFVSRYVDLWDVRPSRKALSEEDQQFSRANYHQGAVTEAMTNFLLHRDWSVTEKVARVNIYEDSIEFLNPVRLLELPINSIRYGIEQAPNPSLKTVFTNRHYGLTIPQGGVPMICAEASAFARRPPDGLAINGLEFRLKLYGWK